MDNQFAPVTPPKSEGLKIAKAFGYLFLAMFKAAVQSLVTLVFLIFGLFLAANSVETLIPLRDQIMNIQGLIFFILWIFETIVNFKVIKK